MRLLLDADAESFLKSPRISKTCKTGNTTNTDHCGDGNGMTESKWWDESRKCARNSLDMRDGF